MNITLTIEDEIGTRLQEIATARFPEVATTKVVKKLLKQYIASLLDEKARQDVIGADEAALESMKQQVRTLQEQQMKAQNELMKKKNEVLPTLPVTDLGD